MLKLGKLTLSAAALTAGIAATQAHAGVEENQANCKRQADAVVAYRTDVNKRNAAIDIGSSIIGVIAGNRNPGYAAESAARRAAYATQADARKNDLAWRSEYRRCVTEANAADRKMIRSHPVKAK